MIARSGWRSSTFRYDSKVTALHLGTAAQIIVKLQYQMDQHYKVNQKASLGFGFNLLEKIHDFQTLQGYHELKGKELSTRDQEHLDQISLAILPPYDSQ